MQKLLKRVLRFLERVIKTDNIEKWIKEKLREGHSIEQLKEALREEGYDPTIIDEVLKEKEDEEKIAIVEKKSYKKPIIYIGLIIFSILIIYFLSIMILEKTPTASPKLFGSSFESSVYDGTPIVGVQNEVYTFNNYPNVPPKWKVKFRPSGEFQWVDDVYRSGSKAIKMSSFEGMTVERDFSVIDLDKTKKYMIILWTKTNNLHNSFGFAEIRYWDTIDKGVKPIPLTTSGKIIGSNDWKKVTLNFKIPEEAIRIAIKLKLNNTNVPEYLEMPIKYNNTAEYDPNLSNETIWFDNIRMYIGK